MKRNHFLWVLPLLTILFFMACADEPLGPRVMNPPRNLAGWGEDKLANLSWLAPDAGSNGTLSHYKVFRNDVLVAETENLFFTDVGLVNGLRYRYHVVAVYRFNSRDWDSDPSFQIEVLPPVRLFNPPQHMQAYPERPFLGELRIYNHWSAPLDGYFGELVGYKLFRNSDLISRFDRNNRMYTDYDVVPRATYVYYTVAIYNFEGQEHDSNPSNLVQIQFIPTDDDGGDDDDDDDGGE
ncbi:MAG: hypothetical protein FWG98_12010 [Candidatus Cloacimonetes bacterium]|nr:hypothetical protein [Candidatus Cloacimonadota bacterium]